MRRLTSVHLGRMPALPLAVLRIGFSAALLFEIRALLELRRLYFDPQPFLDPTLVPVLPFLLAWMGAAVCLLLGLKTRLAAVINYFFCVSFFGIAAIPAGFECHTDGIITFVSFLFLFMPVSQVLSLDALCARRSGRPFDTRVSRAHFVCVALVVGAVYFDSALWKLVSPMWLAGLGVWIPATQPFDAFVRVPVLLDVRPLVVVASHVTLIYEILFLFLIWFRRLRLPLLAIGFALHVGIMTLLPLPVFGLLMTSLLLGLVPADVYWRLARRGRGAVPDSVPDSVPVPVPVPVPVSVSVPVPIPDGGVRRSGRLQTVAFVGFLAVWSVLFALCIAQPVEVLMRYGFAGVDGPVPVQGRVTYVEPIGSPQQGEAGGIRRAYARVLRFAYVALGMRSHPIFLDGQFCDYAAETRIIYRPRGVPAGVDDRRFYPRIRNRLWLAWTYRYVRARFPVGRAETQLRRFATYWAIRRGLDLEQGRIVVQQRPIELPTTQWRRGQLERNLAGAWADVALVDGPIERLEFRWMESSWSRR